MAADWNADLQLIAGAAREAGRIAMTFFGQSPEVWWKNEGSSPVSAADFAANDHLLTHLRNARPDYGWLSEETDDDPSRLDCDTVFVVDPIDGTRAFIGGRKTWCVSVAVVHHGLPVAGVLVAPALDEEFTAVAEGPALLNGRPISVSPPETREKLQVATSQDMLNAMGQAFRDGVDRVEHIPSLAYRLAMIADGRIDATLVKRNSHDWDLAAADLILARAGGALVDLEGHALVYNGREVAHGVLCAASQPFLPVFLRELATSAHG